MIKEKKTSPKAALDTNYNYEDWKDVSCSVCMEYPHNAVLLLCSSHDKGCRPYMCATTTHHSNCLQLYNKAYTKLPCCRCQLPELTCPLCRGQVKGWTVVEPARNYFNTKKRACMKENCSFVGSYRELKKHVKADHPCACPREADPTRVSKWRRLEEERDLDDAISTIRSSMPGAVLLGDYVIDSNYHEDDFLESPRGRENDRISPHGRSENHQHSSQSSRMTSVNRFTRYNRRFLSPRFGLRRLARERHR